VSFETMLAAASARPADRQLLAELAKESLEAGKEERALPLLARATGDQADARLWQWKGLLERALDMHEAALVSFGEAARLAPGDPSIAHGYARVALEAGVDAEALYEHALRLAPRDGQLVVGLAAARLGAGHGEKAVSELESILDRSPLWIEGHMQLAQLRAMLGRKDEAGKSIRRALARYPRDAGLWQGLLDLALKQEDYAALEPLVAEARQSAAQMIAGYAFIAASELGRSDAEVLHDVATRSGADLPVWRVRQLIRSGRLDEAGELIDREIEAGRCDSIWPYAAIAWRSLGDARSEWLERGNAAISVTPLLTPPECSELATSLRALHVARGEYLDQSVRGGTQTDGPLLSRIDPVIRYLREKIVAAVETYASRLPAIDSAHPTLRHPRDRRVRFAGSWSVRLKGRGFHAAHVHPQGWISSALYVALPDTTRDAPHAGWLALGGAPDDLGIDLPPISHVEPKLGQLILFPSWMWHRTAPYEAGERLTVAFDVAPPVGGPSN
jgi:tetratricopeptide (TPR) repeat protein